MNENLTAIKNILAAKNDAEYPYLASGYTVRNIKTIGNDTYIGYSAPSTSTSDKTWVIKKVTADDSAGTVEIRYANKVDWDNYVTHTYSL